ncbi:hypothetical protein GCM10010439_55490 [Actinocorallia aurantiaca]|uniref:Uncharacterized protein n=1 Tax=Actinocorallia aurantiaca TaxID=46204 RepID=A0ABP6GZ62_9ACTN
MNTSPTNAAYPHYAPVDLPPELLPQSRPTPTCQETRAVTTFLRARLQAATQATLHSSRPCSQTELLVGHRLLAPGGLLDRYATATAWAAHAPEGLEEAWGLVAATLAVEAADLAHAWADHPNFPYPNTY